MNTNALRKDGVVKRSHQRIKAGDRFGKLVVLELGKRTGRTEYFDLCRCDCGEVKWLRRGALQTGNTRSCGCLGDSWKQGGFGEWLTKHGRSRTKLYIWWNSHHRTKGTLCSEWQNDFTVMLRDTGDLMEEEGLVPYRPNPHLPYGPRNFQWGGW